MLSYTLRRILAAIPAEQQDCFDVVAAGDCVPAKKPAPDIYSLAFYVIAVFCNAFVVLKQQSISFGGAVSANYVKRFLGVKFYRD